MNTVNVILACMFIFILIFAIVTFIVGLIKEPNDSKYIDVLFLSVGTIGLFLSCVL